jgi:hypothetical protein
VKVITTFGPCEWKGASRVKGVWFTCEGEDTGMIS